jgi:hypothetical protein
MYWWKNDAFAHFAETFRMRRMAQRMITASHHSSAECAYGAWRGLFLCPVIRTACNWNYGNTSEWPVTQTVANTVYSYLVTACNPNYGQYLRTACNPTMCVSILVLKLGFFVENHLQKGQQDQGNLNWRKSAIKNLIRISTITAAQTNHKWDFRNIFSTWGASTYAIQSVQRLNSSDVVKN